MQGRAICNDTRRVAVGCQCKRNADNLTATVAFTWAKQGQNHCAKFVRGPERGLPGRPEGLRRRPEGAPTYGHAQAREKPQAARSRGVEGPQAAGDGHQGAAGARESAGGNETAVGSRKKPAPRGRGGGALRAAKSKAQAETSRPLIAICSDPYTAAGVDSIETAPAIWYYITVSNVYFIPTR